MSGIEELEDRLTALEALYADLEAAGAGRTGAGTTVREPLYPDVYAWVESWFAPVFGRRLGRVKWCARWWAHAEAIYRLEAAWRAWEVSRLDPWLGPSVWIREALVPLWDGLMTEGGTFDGCDAKQHEPAPDLPIDPRPPEPAAIEHPQLSLVEQEEGR